MSVFRLAPRPPRRRFAPGGPRAPIAWWKFDSALTDSTNNHYDGTFVGSAPTYEAGHLGNALRLSGAGGGSAEYVSFGDQDALIGSTRTYAGWVWFDVATGQRAIISKIEASGSFFGFHWEVLAQTVGATSRVFIDSSTAALSVTNFVITGQWVHIALVLDAGTIRMYRNGSRIGADGSYNPATPTANAVNFTIGHQDGAPNRDLDGAVDDWRVYDFALSDAQVAALAELETGTAPGTIAGSATVLGQGAWIQAAAGTSQGQATVTGISSYDAHPVIFDGTNDYLLRNADLNGNADSRSWTGSVWVNRATTGAATQNIGVGQGGMWEVAFTNNLLTIQARNSANTIICSISSSAITTTARWHHIMWSLDLTNAANRHLYVDGVADLAVTTYTNADIDFTRTNHAIGAGITGSGKLNGQLADLQLWFGTYVDLSVAGNRALFLADGKPVPPSTAAASLGQPIIALTAQTTAAWPTNAGTGGGFTLTGTLTDGTTPVELAASGITAGTAAGAATVAGAGTGIVSTVGTAAGAATVAGVGASAQAGAGTSQGQATIVGQGAAAAASAGSIAGVATVNGVGARTADAAGTTAGVATIAGVGARTAAGVGSAAGVATVSGVGARTAAAFGTSQGSVFVSGQTTAAGFSSATGTAAGVATVAGVGAWSQLTAVQGTAAGAATVTGTTAAGAIGDPDLSHSIHASLVMFVGSHPTGAAELAHERIANGLVTTFGAADFTTNHPDKPWKCLRTTGGASGAWTPLTTQFRQITGNFTLWFDLIPVGFAASSHIIDVPWDGSVNWSAPFSVLDYYRQTTNPRAQFAIVAAPGSIRTAFPGVTTGSFPTDTARKRFWCRRSGTTVTLGIGATTLETFTGVSSASPNWAAQTSGKIVFGARKPENTAAEAFGATWLRAMAWNRALSDAELAQLDADPLLGLIVTTVTAVSAAGTAQGQASVTGATPITTAPQFTSSGYYGGASFGETGFGESRFVVPSTAAVGDGTAQGIAAVSGVGARIAAFLGTCTAAALVAGATTTIKGTAGTAAGTATVAGVGAGQSDAVGSAAGSATVAGVGALTYAAVGSAAGSATVAGNTATTGTAIGTAAAAATVRGIGPCLRTQADLRGLVIGAGMRNWSVFSGTPGLQTLVEREYNGLTPGTAFKWNVIEPSQGVFDFTDGDLFVAWADDPTRNLPLRLGTLVSHNNLAPWVPGALVPGTGNWQSIITTHIAGVLGHYPNRPWNIEVVSDAFNPGDGLVGGFRNSLWYQNAAATAGKTGPDYIVHAFQQAALAEPFAALFLSDFGVEQPGQDQKRADILAALENWLNQGVPIHGFSIQGHLQPAVALDVPGFRAFLRGLTDLGISIAISEFDFREIAALGLGDAAAFAALSAQAKLFLEVALDEGAYSITTWGVAPEDWDATGTEQIPAVPFGTSPGFTTNPIFDGIDLAFQGVSGRIEGVATVIGKSSYGVTGSAQGAATVISIGGQIQDAAGTAEGFASVEGEAAVYASAAGTATGVATVAGQGERTAAAAATSAGIATVTGVGSSTAAVAGSATGTATVNGFGARVAAVVGTAAGVATVFGISEQGSTRGEAVGISQVAGQGARTAAGAGTVQGTATGAGVGASTQAAAGTVAGLATVAGAGARVAETAGTAAGVATATGISQLGSTVGTGAGLATVVGRGAWIIAVSGSAAGTATVTGTSAGTISAAGTAAGTASVAGEGARIAATAGTVQGTATVSAITEQGSTTGQATGTSAASGVGARVGAAAATASGIAQAQATGAWIAATVGTAQGVATATAASMPEPFVPLTGVIWRPDREMATVTWGKGEPGPVKWPRAA